MNLITMLLGNWRLIALGLLLAIIGGMFAYIEILKLQKADLTTENKSIKFQLQSSQSNVKRLAEDILKQNLEVDRIKTEGDERLAKANEALKKAQLSATSNKQRAQEIIKRLPPEGMPLCQAADGLFNEAIKRNATP